MAAMAAEHCDVAPGEPESTEWGASDKPFTTGNYSLTTTPRQEYMLVAELKQADGKKLQEGEFVPGAYQPDGAGGGEVREKLGLRRQVVSIAELMKTAVRRKCFLGAWLSLHNAIACCKSVKAVCRTQPCSSFCLCVCVQPTRIHAMLKELHISRKMPFDLTVDQIAVQFAASGVNRAELTALRMYTGPCFEFCAQHLASLPCH